MPPEPILRPARWSHRCLGGHELIVLSFDSSPGAIPLPGEGRAGGKSRFRSRHPGGTHAAHPGFAAKAVFNVLPGRENHTSCLDSQYKLRSCATSGVWFDLGNHTWWHQRLDTVDAQEVQRQLAFAVRSIQQAMPGYQVRSFALPLGLWPEDKSLVLKDPTRALPTAP